MSLAISRQLFGLPEPTRPGGVVAVGRFAINPSGRLLPSIHDGRNFHQPHEYPAETARSRIAQTACDAGNTLIGFSEQMTGRIEADFGNHLAIARSHPGQMALKRTRTDPQSMRGMLKGWVTLAQQCSYCRAHGMLRKYSTCFHGYGAIGSIPSVLILISSLLCVNLCVESVGRLAIRRQTSRTGSRIRATAARRKVRHYAALRAFERRSNDFLILIITLPLQSLGWRRYRP